jgi:hypothetical protein
MTRTSCTRSGDFFVTSAIEMMRSNYIEYGLAKLSPVAYAEILRVCELALMAREGGELGAERVAEDDPVVAQRSAVSTCGAVWGRERTSPPTSTTATFAGPGAATDEARVGVEAGAEHPRGRFGRERDRNREDIKLVGDDPRRVAALGHDAVGVGVDLAECIRRVGSK